MAPDDIRTVPAGSLGFGRYMATHMALCRYKSGEGWEAPRIVPYQSFMLDPCALVLHYGQSIYEGLKAYARVDGSIGLFRVERNAARFRASATRMAMAELPEHLFVQAAYDLVQQERHLVPTTEGGALYLRPVMIADEAAFGVRRSSSYLFFIVATPVEDLQRPDGRGLRLRVTEEFARIASTGGGDAKTSGNYARTILALDEARALGFDNVIWLDPVHRDFIEEAGITNIFVRTAAGKLLTPPLNGRILAGVTRETVLAQAASWGLDVEEQEISIAQLATAVLDGEVSEIFLTGTATHIAPVASFAWREREYLLPPVDFSSSLAGRFSSHIRDVQTGRKPDLDKWMTLVVDSRRFAT
nr:branched-chain amino acid aminotransferase [Rhizobium sp. FKY42]